MKLFAILTAAMVFTIIFSSSATTIYMQPNGYEKVDGYIDINTSYLAPTPVNYTLIPIVMPHEIYIGSNDFMKITEN